MEAKGALPPKLQRAEATSSTRLRDASRPRTAAKEEAA